MTAIQFYDKKNKLFSFRVTNERDARAAKKRFDAKGYGIKAAWYIEKSGNEYTKKIRI